MHEQFAELIAEECGFPLTDEQRYAATGFARFLLTSQSDCALILTGYAGTGKTSLIGALVRVLRKVEHDVVLLAPTGRAAKVLAAHAGYPAYTIHKVIYRQESWTGEDTAFSLGFNKNKDTLFIVDEASMLARGTGGSTVFGTGELLDDLIRFVYSGKGCRLLLVGDMAQLPPVGEEESPALSRRYIAGYGLTTGIISLTEVFRQSEQSGVLANATSLRLLLTEGVEQLPLIKGSEHGEVRFLAGEELQDSLETDYDNYGEEDTIVITRSNKWANLYNEFIRMRILGREEQLEGNDLVMAVKNNYYWTEQAARSLPKGERLPMDFIANGDTARVVRVRNVHEQYDFLFADATLRFPDYDGLELDCRVLLSTLTSEAPALSQAESQHLYEQVLADYADIPAKKDRLKRVREDAYYNALQIKYAYAVTCHKAQGGGWARVYIDQGYLPPDISHRAYLRWLYTGMTRSTDRVYLINWPENQRAHL